MAYEEACYQQNGEISGPPLSPVYDDIEGEERSDQLEDAVQRIHQLEDDQMNMREQSDSELNKLRAWYTQLELKWKEEKDRADNEIANAQLVHQEKQHLQQQINELQSAAGNMASTAESVHKWLEERTRTARRECREEKTRADQATAHAQALAAERQDLVQQLEELHLATDKMVTTAAESVHQLVEERTQATMTEAMQEKARADDEAQRVLALEEEKEVLLEKLIALQRDQLQAAEMDQQHYGSATTDPQCHFIGSATTDNWHQPDNSGFAQLGNFPAEVCSTLDFTAVEIAAAGDFVSAGEYRDCSLPLTYSEAPVIPEGVRSDSTYPVPSRETASPEAESRWMPQPEVVYQAGSGRVIVPENVHMAGSAQTAPEGSSARVLSASQPTYVSPSQIQPAPVSRASYAYTGAGLAAPKSPVTQNQGPRLTSPMLGPVLRRPMPSNVSAPFKTSTFSTNVTPNVTPVPSNRITLTQSNVSCDPVSSNTVVNSMVPRPSSIQRQTSPEIMRTYDIEGRHTATTTTLANDDPTHERIMRRSKLSQYGLVSPNRADQFPNRSRSAPMQRMSSDRPSRTRSIERRNSARMSRNSSDSRGRSLLAGPNPNDAVSVTTLESVAKAAAEARPVSPRLSPCTLSHVTLAPGSLNASLGSAVQQGQLVRQTSPSGAGSTASLHTLAGSIGTPVGVGVTRSVSPALAQYQFMRSPVMTQVGTIPGSQGSSVQLYPGDTISPAESRSTSVHSVHRSASIPASLYTSPSSSRASSRNNSLVPPARPLRKRSEPAGRAQLPRLTSGVAWHPSDDADVGVVIATVNDKAKATRPGSITRPMMVPALTNLSAASSSSKFEFTTFPTETDIDFPNLREVITAAATVNGSAFLSRESSRESSQRLSLGGLRLNDSTTQDGYGSLTCGGFASASQTTIGPSRRASSPLQPTRSNITRQGVGLDGKMPSTPGMSSTSRILGTSAGTSQAIADSVVPFFPGVSPLLTPRGRLQAHKVDQTIISSKANGSSLTRQVSQGGSLTLPMANAGALGTRLTQAPGGSLQVPTGTGLGLGTRGSLQVPMPVRCDNAPIMQGFTSPPPSHRSSTPCLLTTPRSSVRIAQRQTTPLEVGQTSESPPSLMLVQQSQTAEQIESPTASGFQSQPSSLYLPVRSVERNQSPPPTLFPRENSRPVVQMPVVPPVSARATTGAVHIPGRALTPQTARRSIATPMAQTRAVSPHAPTPAAQTRAISPLAAPRRMAPSSVQLSMPTLPFQSPAAQARPELGNISVTPRMPTRAQVPLEQGQIFAPRLAPDQLQIPAWVSPGLLNPQTTLPQQTRMGGTIRTSAQTISGGVSVAPQSVRASTPLRSMLGPQPVGMFTPRSPR